MDLLFKRYANPFLLLDNLISSSRFVEFIDEIIKLHNEEQIYDVWVRRVFDKTFEEFKQQVQEANEVSETDHQDVETTIQESINILNNFNPEKG